MAEEDLRWLTRHSKRAEVRLAAFNELIKRGLDPDEKKIRWPKAMELAFEPSTGIAAAETAALFAQFRDQRRTELQTGLFAQRTRLVRAERALAEKETKKALNEKRIATDKVAWHQQQLEHLDRKELRSTDGRIYPQWYTAVLANVDGSPVVMPMRYHCRQNGKPASIDKEFDGLYNARRDNLAGYWKNVWRKRHAVMPAWAFYENVALNDYEHRELRPREKAQNVVLEFKPAITEPMFFACVWDKWEKAGEPALYSFAVITDEPPPEVAATGHDRCPIPLKPDHIEAWLSPEEHTEEELNAILDDRQRHFYEHRKAA